ncbi:DUF5366 family protein [Evansella tamaricis]|uniref:YufK family protein n=1 Tax=Evansella tamaricis TaxID=2069301 RepID=A0ABS6JI19_9BACI|nr:DUF5366 family protein [Evansella tamaricis]MBU9713178.1 YufK family protein [Evansella tamaricis]
MRNAYLTSHFPLISIILFSLSFAIYSEQIIIIYLKNIGLYGGMIEFFSERGIQLTLLFLLWLFFFMLFSALKLIADTINELSLLFFSKDQEGTDLKNVRGGAWIFLIGSLCSIAATVHIYFLLGIFAACCLLYFIFFVYKIGESLTSLSLIGMIFFHVFFWFSFGLAIIYALLKLYNSLIASLPV